MEANITKIIYIFFLASFIVAAADFEQEQYAPILSPGEIMMLSTALESIDTPEAQRALMVMCEAISQNLVLPYLGLDFLFLQKSLCCYFEGAIDPPYISFLKKPKNSAWNQSRKKKILSFGCERKICITVYKCNRRFYRNATKEYKGRGSRGLTANLCGPKIWMFEINKPDSVHVLTWCERGLPLDTPAAEPIHPVVEQDLLSLFPEFPLPSVNYENEMDLVVPPFCELVTMCDDFCAIIDDFNAQKIVETCQKKLEDIFNKTGVLQKPRASIKKKEPKKRLPDTHKKNSSDQ